MINQKLRQALGKPIFVPIQHTYFYCNPNPVEPGLRCVLVEGPGVASLVTVLVTIVNVPPSPLIAQPNGLIACIHSVSVAACHSCWRSVSDTHWSQEVTVIEAV